SVLLALLLARVAREEPAALDLRAQRLVDADQGAGDAVAQRAGLARGAAAAHARRDVPARGLVDEVERLLHDRAQHLAPEVLVERAAVHQDRAGSGLHADAGHGHLALARGRLGE